MPEGDTVYRAAQALDKALAGQRLTRCDVRVPRFATIDLSGQIVDGAAARGKHLLIRVGETSIHSHLAMEGHWQILAVGERWNRPAFQARIVLETPRGQAVGFELGLLEVLPRSREEETLDYLGPDLLGPDWDPDEAHRRLAADPQRPLGLALLDQKNLAGLGNVYRAELCFLQGLLPERPVGEVENLASVVSLAHRLIVANRDRSERVTTGDTRRGRRTWVYGRAGEPCLRCRTRVRRGKIGDDELTQRVTFFCPRCQR